MGKSKESRKDRRETSRKERERGHPRFRRILWAVGTFILGTVVGPYIISFLVEVLPGPDVKAHVVGFRPIDEPFARCSVYRVFLSANEPIDYVYLKVQFPDKITSHKVGFMYEVVKAEEKESTLEERIGMNNKGECDIVEASVNPEGVQFSAVGNMLTIQYSKLIPNTHIVSTIATTRGDSAPMKMYTSGAYEYSKLGQTVRKRVEVQITRKRARLQK